MSTRDTRRIQEAQARELPDEVLIAELERRGYVMESDKTEPVVFHFKPIRSYEVEMQVIEGSSDE